VKPFLGEESPKTLPLGREKIDLASERKIPFKRRKVVFLEGGSTRKGRSEEKNRTRMGKDSRSPKETEALPTQKVPPPPQRKI